jgi:TatA/E family protein of Tat protein translocase
MGPLDWPEIVFIFVLALLLFGPKKLPELGRTLGRAMTEIRRASNELKATFGLGLLLLLGGALYIAITKYGYHVAPKWPFLTH